MKAFLSHASPDKEFVDQVYRQLGPAQAHMDSATFEKSLLNTEAIHKALADSDIFVLFASRRSIESPFVSAESKLALEKISAGKLQRILVVFIDDITLDDIAPFLRDYNIVTTISTPGAAARRIQAMLTELAIEYEETGSSFWVGREEELAALKESITRPPSESPVAIAVAGQPGSGRRSLARKAFSETLPSFQRYVNLTLPRDAGVDDFYLGLLRVRGRKTAGEARDAISRFFAYDYEDKIATLVSEIVALSEEGETLMLIDRGGLGLADGKYPDYIYDIVSQFKQELRPLFIFIQMYMPPKRVRDQYDGVYFSSIRHLSQNDISSLLGARLKDVGISYTTEQLNALVRITGGHPLNVDFVVAELQDVGGDISLFLADPTNLVVWKDKRAEDFLKRINFNEKERRVIGLLLIYRYLPLELLIGASSLSAKEVAEAINYLRGWHCIVNEEGVYEISPALVDALDRMEIFRLSKDDEVRSAQNIGTIVSEYRDIDDIEVSILEPAIISSIRSGEGRTTSQLRTLLLPSHLLKMARDSYNRRRYPDTLRFVDEALEKRHRMTADAIVEALRLQALCAIRLDKSKLLSAAITDLGSIKGNNARRTVWFVKAYNARLAGVLDDAEKFYLKVLELQAKNYAASRELAQIYLWQDRITEAATYARAAYESSPTNPYAIDAVLGVLMGMATPDDFASGSEIDLLLKELESSSRGSMSFYPRRMAEKCIILGQLQEAKSWADQAVLETPHLVLPLYVRANILISQKKFKPAEEDINLIREIIADASKDEGRFHLIHWYKLRFRLHIEKREYRKAFNLVSAMFNDIPRGVAGSLRRELAVAVLFDETLRDAQLISWANAHKV